MQAESDPSMDLVSYDEAAVRNIIANDQQLLDTKMEKVYKLGMYPKLTVFDIYNVSERTRAPGIPQEIELAYYLRHYGDFVRTNWTARQDEADFNVAKVSLDVGCA